jgi:hypothetical protein
MLRSLSRSIVLARPATIIFFILQNIVYIYLDFIFAIYNKHTGVLLVSFLRVVFPSIGP